MSSIIVLDSSDEDESPPKKAHVKSATDSSNISSVTNASATKSQNAKQRAIPSGITITPRLSPTSLGTKSVNMQSLNTNSLAASFLALNNIINDERQTPTPPKVPQIPGGLNQRKRKTPTPPQTMPRLTAKNYATMTNSSPAKAATTVAPLPPIMPMITGVHSMAAAGATPPLQLMATPPHNLGAFMGLNEQLMINPHLIPSGLPPNTTITAHPNPNQNNINNNFKIHLPFNKPTTTTPSPAASPASSAPKTPSPQLTSSPQPSRADKHAAKRIKPTTLLKSSDESWQRHKQYSTQSDKQQSHRTPISLNNDVVIEMLPPATDSPKSISASSSRHHTPMTSPTTPKSQKSPDVIMLTTPTEHNTSNARKDCETVLDLTQSPDKLKRLTAIPSKPTEIVDLVNTPEHKEKQEINGDANNTKTDKKPEKPPPKPPLEPEYEELIKACRKADPSKDMEKLIKSKLIKYYYEVHTDFVKSKSFRKSICKVVEAIKAKPELVYFNLKTIVEELKVRRKARLVEEAAAANAATTTSTATAANNSSAEKPATVLNVKENIEKITTTTESNVPATSTSTSSTSAADISATASPFTGNKKLDEQIKKLNKALYVLTKRIEVLEQSEVDWDDDDSSFLQVERFKKRACQIYEKICDLTGESKNAHRLVKRPIKFNETRIPQFNKTLQGFINRTKEFPDYFDVLRMLEHCNRTYNLGLVNFEMKNIAEDAFIKVGKLLQSRRKADLYETVTHYAGDGKDPAKTDPALAAKLNENLKNHKKISDILEKFARKQDMPEEEEEEKAEKTPDSTEELEAKTDVIKMEMEAEAETVQTTPITMETINNDDQKEEKVKLELLIKSEKTENVVETAGLVQIEIDDDEEEEDEDDEEEDEDNLDEQVETLANGDVSDNESDIEIMSTKNSDNTLRDTCQQDKSLVSLNNDSKEMLEKSLATEKVSSDDKLAPECIEIPDSSQEFLKAADTMKNCMDKDTSIISLDSQADSLLINNNNNNNLLDVTTTKTVINTSITNEYSLPNSPSSPPIPPASITPTPNGKLKDIPASHHLLNNNASNLCTATATITTTTTTADLKIVHVSSLEPEAKHTAVTAAAVAAVDNENVSIFMNRNEVGSNLGTVLTSTSTNKSLEEIVISDEES